MRIRFSPQALAQAEAAQGWWKRNRRLAPHLFEDELERGLKLLHVAPLAGPPYQHRRREGVRRLLLQETRYHLYYEIGIEGLVVLAVWSAVRGRPPRL